MMFEGFNATCSTHVILMLTKQFYDWILILYCMTNIAQSFIFSSALTNEQWQYIKKYYIAEIRFSFFK